MSDVSHTSFFKCLDHPSPFDENNIRMDEVLEDVKPVKIDILLLDIIKQLLPMPYYSTNFALKLENLKHIFQHS